MPVETDQLDPIMEQASRALADIDYLGCEVLCLKALAIARQSARYGYYARILLPLQEARRQRRMIAAAGSIQLGSMADGFTPEAWLDEHPAGCIVLTHPHTAEDAKALDVSARRNNQCVEVLYADNPAEDRTWTIRAYTGEPVSCEVDAPQEIDRPAQWFIHASEQLGNAAIQSVDPQLAGPARVEALEVRLTVFPDHELLHQRLADAARAVRD